jgi:CubicO group peptidase (beta-lactamase class C family)
MNMITRRRFIGQALGGSLAVVSCAAEACVTGQAAALLDKATHARIAPGYTAFVGRGARSWTFATGLQDLATNEPMRSDTIFRVASITKPVVAAAAMLLIDDGKIALGDPIDRWIPELANRRVVRSLSSPIDDCVPASRRITVHDLLSLQMGLGALFDDPKDCPLLRQFTDLGISPGPAMFGGSSQDFIDRLGSLPLAYHPGQRWLYHTGMEVAGILVSRVAGQPLSAFVDERLTGPLGMKDTGFFVPPAKQPRLATSYIRAPNGTLRVHDDAMGGRFAKLPAMESGGSGLVSTAEDFARFGRMLLDDGRNEGRTILSERSARLMRTDQLPADVKAASPFFPGFWDTYTWGLGAAVSTSSDSTSKSGRFGWWGGTGTTFFIDPGSGTVGVLLSQRMMTGPDDTAVSNAFLKAAFDNCMAA